MLKDMYDVFEDETNDIYQIRCKDDIITVEFDDKDKKHIFEKIIQLSSNRNMESISEIIDYLCKNHKKSKVYDVINNLIELDMIEEENPKVNFNSELYEQVKYWNKNGFESADKLQHIIENTQLLIMGNNILTTKVHERALESGFHLSKVEELNFDDFCIADIKQMIAASDFFIVDAEQWNPYFLEEINYIALELDKPWIIIMGINDSKLSVGPLFVGRETGCYNCLNSRLKSNMEFLPHFEEYEKYLKSNKKSARNGGGPIVAYDILASISILETMKFITNWAVPALYKSYITLDFHSYDIFVHPLLKIPGCPACKPEHEMHPAPWLEPIILNGKKK